MAPASRRRQRPAPRPRSGNGAPPSRPPPRATTASPRSAARSICWKRCPRIGPAPLAALAESARCTRTAGFRLLRTLEARGFAIQDEARGMWRLGARWGVLGRAAAEQGALAATAMPFLAALGKASGENVYLRVRDGLESETDRDLPDRSRPAALQRGRQAPARCMPGSSRLLLAHAPEAVQTQVLAQRLPRFTPATRTDAAWIAADLQRIRTRGYLLTTDEVVAGAATRRRTGARRLRPGGGGAARSARPSMRMRPPRPRALLPLVLDAAMKLSQMLGDASAVAKPRNGQERATPAPAAPRWNEGHGAASAGPHSIFR